MSEPRVIAKIESFTAKDPLAHLRAADPWQDFCEIEKIALGADVPS